MPTNPRLCLAPDAFVKLRVPQTLFGTWKSWQHGAPDLAVELVSPNDGDGLAWDEKLARYAELGVAELLRFDPEAREGERMRAWDRIDEDLVERQVDGDSTPCVTLGWMWVVRPVEGVDAGLRLADANGAIVLTQAETADTTRRDAEARVLALEEELRRYRDPTSR